jgi:hypothetical protein
MHRRIKIYEENYVLKKTLATSGLIVATAAIGLLMGTPAHAAPANEKHGKKGQCCGPVINLETKNIILNKANSKSISDAEGAEIEDAAAAADRAEKVADQAGRNMEPGAEPHTDSSSSESMAPTDNAAPSDNSAQTESAAPVNAEEEQRAQDQRAQEQGAQDQMAQEQGAQDPMARDQQAQDQGAQDQQAQDQQAQDQMAQDQQAQEQGAQDQMAQDQGQEPAPQSAE